MVTLILLWSACVVLAIAAAGGGTMLAMRLGKRPIPKPLPVAHVSAALLGIALVVGAVFTTRFAPILLVALGIIAVAASIGLVMAVRRARGDPAPIGLVLGHGTIALLGVVLLFAAAVAKTIATDGTG